MDARPKRHLEIPSSPPPDAPNPNRATCGRSPADLAESVSSLAAETSRVCALNGRKLRARGFASFRGSQLRAISFWRWIGERPDHRQHRRAEIRVQHRSRFGRNRSNLSKSRNAFGRNWAIVGQLCWTLANFGRIRFRFGRNQPTLVELGPDSVEVAPTSVDTDRSWPKPTRLGQPFG